MSGRQVLGVTGLLIAALFSVAAHPGWLLPGRPFIAVWNAPTSQCREKYGVDLDLQPFDIVVNQNQSFAGSEMVIFYKNQLGLYPYYDQSDLPTNGGLPQNASLEEHLNVSRGELPESIPAPNFTGAGVIDWEDWRPLWDRNWDTKDIYRRRSQELVKEQHPEWPGDKVAAEARREFEEAAAAFMASTLALCRKLRPDGLWGFYGFPDCYNYDYRKPGSNYSGECPETEVARNDLLGWLWGASRALYPSIYLEHMLKGSQYVRPFVKHRLLEAFRVTGGDLPVLPYARIVYTYSMDFLTQEDLIQTIGESAALGAAGVILWGNDDYIQSKEACLAVKLYIDAILGAYVVNVTCGAALCSQALCAGNGRCMRRDSSSDAHLHLSPDSFSIKRILGGGGFQVLGVASALDVSRMDAHFQCRCYPGWKGRNCSQPTPT